MTSTVAVQIYDVGRDSFVVVEIPAEKVPSCVRVFPSEDAAYDWLRTDYMQEPRWWRQYGWLGESRHE